MPGKIIPGAPIAILDQSGVAASVTGTTAEVVLASIFVPPGVLLGDGMLRISALWTVNYNANAKSLRTRIGAAAFKDLNAANQVSVHYCNFIRARGNNELRAHYQYDVYDIGWQAGPNASAAVDLFAQQIVTLTGQLANPADSITLEGYTVELCRA